MCVDLNTMSMLQRNILTCKQCKKKTTWSHICSHNGNFLQSLCFYCLIVIFLKFPNYMTITRWLLWQHVQMTYTCKDRGGLFNKIKKGTHSRYKILLMRRSQDLSEFWMKMWRFFFIYEVDKWFFFLKKTVRLFLFL